MPTYSITGPDGKTYSIDGPAGATRDQVIAKIQERQAAQGGGEEPSTAGDVVKSFGRGVVQGTAGLAGMVGDLSTGLNRAIDAGERMVGMDVPEQDYKNPLGSESILRGVENVAGKFDKPHTRLGRYAQSIGEFVPSSVIGPGGKLVKLATTIGGGTGTEWAGEMTGDDPTARFVGGVIGGGVPGLIGTEGKTRQLQKLLPDEAAHKAAAEAAYDQIAQARLRVDQQAVDDLTSDVKNTLDVNHLITSTVKTNPKTGKVISERSDSAPRTWAAFAQLDRSNGDIAKIMTAREALGKIGPQEGADYTAAKVLRDEIDKWMDNIPPNQVITGNPKFTKAMWDHARANWKTYRSLEEVRQLRSKAMRQADKSGSGGNENTFRQRFDEILNSERRSARYSPAARKKIEDIVHGGTLQNLARRVGKVAPEGPVSSGPAIAAGLTAGPHAGYAVAGAGILGKALSKYLTHRQIRQLEELIKSESPIGKPVARQIAPQKPNVAAALPAAAVRSEAGSGDTNEPLRVTVHPRSAQSMLDNPSGLDLQ